MYKLSEAAASDIENMFTRSVVDFGIEQTETYSLSLNQCLELLGDNPEMGTTADDIRPGYRYFLHENHIIFYIPHKRDILIVRILHKRMDVNQTFNN